MSLSAEQIFELGRLYFDRGEFPLALAKLHEAAQASFNERDFARYLKCQNLILRIHVEREEFDQINATKERLQDLVLREGFELGSRTYYTLANCAALKGQRELAVDYLQKALAIALAADCKEDVCYALYGLASTHTNTNPPRLDEALKELTRIQTFHEFLDLPELKISTQMLTAWIYKTAGKFEEAIEWNWKAYEDLKRTKNHSQTVWLFYNLASNYADLSDNESARMYANLARRSIEPENYVRLTRELNTLLERIGAATDSQYDLVFNEVESCVIEKKRGRVDLKNQFILLDLLKLFVRNPGSVYSKEDLTAHIWKTAYDQDVHDNKIYVTIKRLRKLIEPDVEKPKYIFRGKNGYYMNKAARVFIAAN